MDPERVEEFKREAEEWLRLVARTLYQMSEEVEDRDLRRYILAVYEEVVTTPPEEMVSIFPLIAQLEEVLGEGSEHAKKIYELIRKAPTPLILKNPDPL